MTLRTKTHGFTFLELLVVIVIIGIMAAMIGPAISSTDTVRVKTASRGLMQMSRFARTMAVLRQQTMMLTISSDGTLSIMPKGGASALSAPAADGEAPADGENSNDTDSAAPPEIGSEMSVAETEKTYKQVTFSVTLDETQLQDEEEGKEMIVQETDKDADSAEEMPQSRKSASIPYAGNGRCLPYCVTISPTDDKGEALEGAWQLQVRVDRFGNAKILDEDENGKWIHAH